MCALLAALLAAACGGGDRAIPVPPPPPPPVDPTAFTIERNAAGVPHVRSASLEGVAKGLGFAYASDNFCLIQDNVVTVNGERSRLFGAETLFEYQPLKTVANLESDFYYRFVIDSDRARSVHEASDDNTRAMLRGYLAGVNMYFVNTPSDQIDPVCRSYARALTLTDLYRVITDRLTRAGSVAFLAQLAAAPTPPAASAVAQRNTTRALARNRAVALPPGAAWPPTALRHFASNGWAFGRDVVDPAQGRAVLFGNPHFPYAGFERLYEARLTVPGQLDVSGVTMLGVPVIVLGYNKNLAWTHTVSTARRFTLHELALKPGEPLRYLVDGAEKAMTPVDVSVPLADGSTSTRRYYRTEFGPLIQLPHPQIGLTWTATRAYALQDVNLDNNRTVATWLAVGKARDVRELRDAMGTLRGAPYVNTIAADRSGEVLFGDLSAVPNVSLTQVAGGCKPSATAQAWLNPALSVFVLDGSKSACHWGRGDLPAAQRLLPLDRLPSLIRTDFVANSNDSYWLANPEHAFADDLSPLLGGMNVKVPQGLRTRAGLTLIGQHLDGGQKISADALKTLWARNDNFAASLVVDDLLTMFAPGVSTIVTASNGQLVQAAGALAVLQAWDRTSRTDSRGAVLFRELWSRLANGKSIFSVAFDPARPVSTPRGLDAAKHATVSAALGDAILALQAQNVALDAMLGDVQLVEAGATRHAVPGGEEIEGVLNKTSSRPLAAGRYAPVQGTSYLQIVTLGNGATRGEGFLTYSQSTDARSPHAADQLPLWSQLSTRPLPTLP